MRKDLPQPRTDKTISPRRGLRVLTAIGLVGTLLAGCSADPGRETYSIQTAKAMVPASTVMVPASKTIQKPMPVGNALGVAPVKAAPKSPTQTPVSAPVPKVAPQPSPVSPAPEEKITTKSADLRGPLDVTMRGKVEEVEEDDETPLAVTLYE